MEYHIAATALVVALSIATVHANIPTSCPTTDSSDTTIHIAHETDCTKFYMCSGGEKIMKDCRDIDEAGNKLHFNPILQVCDWPDRAGCFRSQPNPPRHHDASDSNIPSSKPQECPSCGYIAHRCDCELFYKCNGTRKEIRQCSEGLHFNPILLTCDLPEHAGCALYDGTTTSRGTGTTSTTESISSTSTTSTPQPTISHSTTETHTETSTKSSSPTGTSPSNPSPTTSDSGNTPTKPSTKPGTEPTLSQPTTKPGTEPTTSKPTTDGSTQSTNQSTATTPSGTIPTECPTEDTEEVVHLPHESDCAKYYKCNGGEKIEMDCPPGLYYNALLQVCDWPWRFSCDDGRSTPSDGNSTGGTTQKPGTGSPPTQCPTEDTEDVVHLPHESDCTKFYKCNGGEKVEMDCPAGLYYNALLQVCDWPWNSLCDDGRSTPDSRNGTTEEPDNGDGSPPTECPTEETGEVVHLPHESDCTKFYKCNGGEKVEMDCPAGLYYNALLQVCDWPWNSLCDDGRSTPDSGNSTTEEPDKGDGSPPTECPTEETEEVVHLPHESDCTKFYKCNGGEKVEMDCPAGLYYNALLQVCDWPWNSLCDDGRSTPDSGNSTTEEPDKGDGSPPTECPTEETEEVVHLPHESDCTKFYKCNGGEKVEMDCPAGLYYNALLQVCDWPWNSLCDDGRSTPDSGNSTTEEPDKGDGSPPTECPTEETEEVVHLPHESDCTKFYKCNGGEKVEMDCPAGLYYNALLQVCDWPWNSLCDDGRSTPDSGNSTTEEPDKGDGSPPTECPTEETEEVVHLPHESDCTKFYKCNGGEKVEMDCPAGLYYNALLQVCDWPWNSLCNDGRSTPDSGNSTTEEPDKGDGSPPTECPTEETEEVVHLPHESDCTKFYKCNGGEKVEMDCPAGLYYNALLQVCDWPWNSLCDDGRSTPDSRNGTTEEPDNGDGSPPTECPTEETGEVVHLPHESDCTKFYKCNGGEKVEMDCPAGLYYNALLQVCDWPWNSLCDDGRSTPDSETSGTSTTEEPDNGDGSPPTQCPTEDTEGVVHLPHETDCTKFYKCNGGEKVEMDCPDGLYYNAPLQLCDWPWNSLCDDGRSTPDGRNRTEGTTQHPGTGGSPPPTQCSEGPNGVVNIPHESDCTKFYKCDNSKQIEMDCPPGLHFNADLQICDWPWNSGCSSGNRTSSGPGPSTEPSTGPPTVESTTKTATEPPTVKPTTEPITEPSTANPPTKPPTKPSTVESTAEPTTESSTANPPTKPPTKPSTVESTAEPTTESSTANPPIKPPTKPSTAEPTTEPTTESSTANPPTKPPTKPSTAEPTTELTTEPSTANPPTKPPTKPSTAEPTTELTTEPSTANPPTEPPTKPSTAEPTTETTTPPTQCSESPNGVVNIPHESDCTKFYKCDNGKQIEMDCPPGLYFNADLQICDWPWNSGCSSDNRTSSGPGPSTEPSTGPPTVESTTKTATEPPTVKPTAEPTTEPSTANPPTKPPTKPSTAKPTTEPTTEPSTVKPPTKPPTKPSTAEPTTEPTTESSTANPPTKPPTKPSTAEPTTELTTEPSAANPPTKPPTKPSTAEPTTETTTEPSTANPPTKPPTKPSTAEPTTEPTTEPSSAKPPTKPPTKPSTTETTAEPSTESSTANPPTKPPTKPSTAEPTTEPTTEPSTAKPPTKPPTKPSTTETTAEPTTESSTANPPTKPPTKPSTAEPTTEPTTESSTAKPPTKPPTKPSTAEPTTELTAEPSTANPPTKPPTKPSTAEPTTEPTTESSTAKPPTKPPTKPSTAEPTTELTTEPSTVNPPSKPPTKPSTAEPTTKATTKPSTAKPPTEPVTDPSPAEPTTKSPTEPSTGKPPTEPVTEPSTIRPTRTTSESGSGSTGSDFPGTGSTGTNQPPTDICKSSNYIDPEGGINNCIGSCPKVDPTDYTVLLYHTNCHLFCYCSNGEKYIFECPKNNSGGLLVFNGDVCA